MKRIHNDIIPTTARYAFKILDGLTTPEDKVEFLFQSKSVFVGKEHFGLGAWIRNNWMYGPEKETEDDAKRREECWDMLMATQHRAPLICDPDWVSSDFLGRYYDHLKRMARKY